MMDAFASIVSNNLNSVMKVLTSVTIIIAVPTLIASIYGMNFQFMPELSWLAGYPVSLGLMVVSAVLPVIYFRRKGWL
jgi:magnesium transporter